MDHIVDGRDFRLLEGDRYTFAVLSRILAGPCSVTLTDHARFILCHSTAPYPVWIWTPDSLTHEEQQRAWATAQSVCPLAGGHRYNLKYELAEAFLTIAREQGLAARIITNMLAYDCPAPIAPVQPAAGRLHRCTAEDTETAAAMICEFHQAVGGSGFDMERCRALAASHIDNHFYFWQDASGTAVACCSLNPSGELGAISSVYTLPAHRRQHYAQQMVYEVTCIAASLGLTPMLYTDADYAASNACYEKIGYLQRGRLCTIGL